MKRIIILLGFMLAFFQAESQIIKGSGWLYFADDTAMNAFVPDISFAAEAAITVNNGRAYTWDRIQDKWVLIDNGGTDDQILSFAGTTLTIENGNSVNLSSLQDGTGTDDQQLTLVGTTLSIESGNSVSLASLQDGIGTDDQNLNLVGTTLSIESGNSVDLSSLQDGIGTDDQLLSLVGTTLSLENGGSVDLSTVQDGIGTDDQNLSLVGNTLSIENGNSVNLSGFVDTDDQQLSLTGTTLSLEDGGSVDLSGLADGTGTDDQQLSLAGTTLTLEDGGSVDLSGLQDGIGTDDQNLSLVGTTLSIESGNSVDLSGLQDGTGTDDQQLSLVGTTLSLEDGGSVDLSVLQDGTGTDDQQLSLAGTTLSLEDGGSVDLSGLQDGTGTDDQQLSLASNILSLEDGGSVDLSPYLDNTDDQQLSLAGTTLSLEDGGSVDLSGLQDGNTNIYNSNGALPINTIRTLGFGNAVSRYRYLDPNNTGNYFEFFNNITSGFNAGIFFNDDDESLTATIGQLGQGVYGIQTESFSVATVKGGFASLINANGDAWFNVDDSGDEARMFSASANYLIGNPGTASSLLQNNNTISRIMAYDHTTGRVYWRDLATMGDGTGTDHQGLSLTGNTLSIDNANSVDLSTISIAKDYAWSENTGSSTIAVTSGVQNGFDSTYGITETTSTANFTYTAINGRWTYNGPDDTPFLVNIKARMITSAKLCDIEMRLLSSTGALSNDSYVSGDGGSDEFFLGTHAVVVLDSGDYIYSTFISGYNVDTTVNDFSLVITEL